MLKSINTIDIKPELINKLRRLGECKYDCEWAGENNYYNNSIVTNKDIPGSVSLATTTDYLLEDNDNFWLPIHAWRLLARLRVIDAINPLIECFNYYPEIEWCKHELPHVFAMLGSQAITSLSNQLSNHSNSEFAVYLIIESMTYIALDKPTEREHIIEVFCKELDHKEDEHIYINTLLVLRLIELQATSKLPNIIDALERGALDTFFTGNVEEIKIQMDVGPKDIEEYDTLSFTTGTNQPLTVRKIGRNEPCPCGSGKKYKKCCI